MDTSSHIPSSRDHATWQATAVERRADGVRPVALQLDRVHRRRLPISFRHLDAIYKITASPRPAASSGSSVAPTRTESLMLVDDPLDGVSGQHDARWHSDGSVSLHDNGNGLGPRRQPRAVRYADRHLGAAQPPWWPTSGMRASRRRLLRLGPVAARRQLGHRVGAGRPRSPRTTRRHPGVRSHRDRPHLPGDPAAAGGVHC